MTASPLVPAACVPIGVSTLCLFDLATFVFCSKILYMYNLHGYTCSYLYIYYPRRKSLRCKIYRNTPKKCKKIKRH